MTDTVDQLTEEIVSPVTKYTIDKGINLGIDHCIKVVQNFQMLFSSTINPVNPAIAGMLQEMITKMNNLKQP